MFRTVMGNPKDPLSRRCILDITPEEFKCLIEILQEKYKSIELFTGLDATSKWSVIMNMSTNMYPGKVLTDDEYNKTLIKFESLWADHYRVIYDFLAAINQPYPIED